MKKARKAAKTTHPPRPRDGSKMVHDLKCWPSPFSAILAGVKTFEVRRDDRQFGEGDYLVLREWKPAELERTVRQGRGKHRVEFVELKIEPRFGHYTGRAILRQIGYVARTADATFLGPSLLGADVVVLALLDIDNTYKAETSEA